MSRKVEAFIGFVRHSYASRSKYRIHSPFVYDFYSTVLQNGTTQPEFRVVNRIRKELEGHSRFIKRKDMGAGSHDFPSDQRFVRVGDIARHSCVSRKKGELLFRIVRKFAPSEILELGTSLGISTMYMALAAPAARIFTIEGCLDSANVARENFDKAGHKNIRILTGNFGDVLPDALAAMPRPDLVFFDGNHKKEATLAYFRECMTHLHQGTVMIFDDIHWSRGMEEAWEEIRRDPAVRVSIDIYHMGFLFFREELSKEDFIIRF